MSKYFISFYFILFVKDICICNKGSTKNKDLKAFNAMLLGNDTVGRLISDMNGKTWKKQSERVSEIETDMGQVFVCARDGLRATICVCVCVCVCGILK